MDDIESLQQHVATLERLLDISRDLNSTLNMRSLLLRIVESARELTDSDAASILLLENKETLRFAAFCGPQVTELKNAEVPIDNSLAGWAVQNNQSVVIDDARKDDRLYVIDASSNIRSIVVVPLVFGDKAIGALENLTHDEPRPFQPKDVETLETLASIAAVAVQNARLFQQNDWIAEIVHEIRTPLTSILSSTEILRHPQIDAETREHITGIIQHETERVSRLVNQFLELAQFESGRMVFKFAPCSIPDIVKQTKAVIQPRAAKRDMQIIAQSPDTLPLVRADAERLEQVLLNLLSNAVKYADAHTDITVGYQLDENGVVVSVTDEGPGIPAKHLPRLFQRFSRLPGSEDRALGSGLGLHIARKIIEAHEGHIWVESDVGEGSTFAFSLPESRLEEPAPVHEDNEHGPPVKAS
jgi:signal transduction histidine kinase